MALYDYATALDNPDDDPLARRRRLSQNMDQMTTGRVGPDAIQSTQMPTMDYPTTPVGSKLMTADPDVAAKAERAAQTLADAKELAHVVQHVVVAAATAGAGAGGAG